MSSRRHQLLAFVAAVAGPAAVGAATVLWLDAVTPGLAAGPAVLAFLADLRSTIVLATAGGMLLAAGAVFAVAAAERRADARSSGAREGDGANEAARERVAALEELADALEATTRSAACSVVDMMEQLTAESRDMAETAHRMSAESMRAKEAAGHASDYMRQTAATTAQLSSSIGRVAGQVENAHVAAEQSVVAARASGAAIGSVAASVERISGIAMMITEIAKKTKLLALNASVEASRAGEDGAGFSVIAREVKDLSEQTAHATIEVGELIEEIRATTGQAMSSVDAITRSVSAVDQASMEISAAIKIQSNATRHISESAAAAEQLTAELARRVADAAELSLSTEALARHVDTVGEQACLEVNGLSYELVRLVRTHSPDVDRRKAQRFGVNGPATLSVAGTMHTVTLVDVSHGGARVAGVAAGVGSRCTLGIPGIAAAFDCVVVNADGNRANLRFDLDMPASAALSGLLVRLGSREPPFALPGPARSPSLEPAARDARRTAAAA